MKSSRTSAQRFLNNTPGATPETDAVFEGETVSSTVCVPFSSLSQDLGCLQFAKTDGSVFSEEEADICEIFSSFLALEIDSDERFQKLEKPADVLLSTRGIKKAYQITDINN